MGLRSAIARAALLVGVLAILSAPSAAEGARVVNGGFESGTLNGWHVSRAIGAGDWFAYAGIAAPIGSKRPNPADPVQPPPRGSFAAIADQANPDTLVLYQDVALEAGLEHELSLLAYYDSYAPIGVPNPNTLSVDEEALRLPNGKLRKNQQFRIDVVKPEAPLESLDATDILATVFATKPGDPLAMAPTRLSADLSGFAGQTVRIRVATAVSDEVLNAGVDAVSIDSFLPGQGPRRRGSKSVAFTFGKLDAKRQRGIATLRVSVPGPGLLRAADALPQAGLSAASGARRPRRSIEPVTVPVAMAKTVTIHLRPTAAVRRALRRRHRFSTRVGVTFKPLGASAETAVLPVAFRLARSSK